MQIYGNKRNIYGNIKKYTEYVCKRIETYKEYVWEYKDI